jgi:hypothetical protein
MAVYYVSVADGIDTNTGLSATPGAPGGPWLTIAKVVATTFAAGDQILFKRGEVFLGNLNLVMAKHSGTSGNPITIGAYSTGAKPILTDSINRSSTDDWTDQGDNIWVLAANTPYPYNVRAAFFNGGATYEPTSWGTQQATLVACDAQGDWYQEWQWPPVAGSTIQMYSVGNPGTFYTRIQLTLRESGGAHAPAGIHDVTFENLHFTHAGKHGVSMLGTTNPILNVTVQDCDFSWMGGNVDPRSSACGCGIEVWDTITNFIFRRNHVWQCCEDGLSIQGTAASSAWNGIYVYQNIIEKCAKGVEVWNTGSGATAANLNICHNVFAYMGSEWGASQRLTGDWEGFMGSSTMPTPTTSKFQNNIILNAADRYIYHSASSALAHLRGFSPDYNCYYGGTNDPAACFKIYSTTYSFADYKTAMGSPYDTHSLNVDPKFVDPTNGDYHLQSSSPCVDTGVVLTNVGQQVIGAGPDMGAYELPLTGFFKKCGIRKT